MDLSTAANLAQIASVLPLLGGAAVLYHHVNCQQKGCRRLGHPFHGHYCRKHSRGRSTEAALDSDEKSGSGREGGEVSRS